MASYEYAGVKQLRRLLDAVMVVASEFSLPIILRRIAETAADLVGARYAAIGVLDEQHRSLAEFITVGIDDDDAAQVPDGADTPEVATMKEDKGAALRRFVDALPEEHRSVIDLAYYHGQSVTEIGEVLNIPVATVKTRMFYARKKLGEALKAAGYDRGWP